MLRAADGYPFPETPHCTEIVLNGQQAAWTISLFLNLFSTVQLGRIAWSHQHMLHKSGIRRNAIVNILSVSSAVFCILWVSAVPVSGGSSAAVDSSRFSIVLAILRTVVLLWVACVRYEPASKRIPAARRNLFNTSHIPYPQQQLHLRARFCCIDFYVLSHTSRHYHRQYQLQGCCAGKLCCTIDVVRQRDCRHLAVASGQRKGVSANGRRRFYDAAQRLSG
ncbi:hypothetical protein BKA62DRAFT_277975 [Auriculariales sp. MPI-PUGE-AT-0066]|nr:hypothetical protein BKA62DRAFT_277975 [Auriculariales sp. MPI-PUGE-AT-0066]